MCHYDAGRRPEVLEAKAEAAAEPDNVAIARESEVFRVRPAQSELNKRTLAPPPALNANPECEIDSSTLRAAVPMQTKNSCSVWLRPRPPDTYGLNRAVWTVGS